MAQTVKLKNYLNVFEEHAAHEAITPGHLVMINSDDEAAKHAVEGGTAFPMFALEDESQGKGITDAYVSGAVVQCWIPTRGDIVNALLADGENVVIGDFLVSKGDGTLKKATSIASVSLDEFPEAIIGVATEAVNMSLSTDPDGRIAVRVI